MPLLKHFSPQEVHRRYRTYRVSNLVYSAVFFVCFLGGVLVSTTRLLTLPGITSAQNFALHWQTRISGGVLDFALYGFLSLLPYFLWTMVFGITIYAPLCSGLAVAVGAYSLGTYFRMLLGYLYGINAGFPVLYFFLGLVPLALLLLVAASFSGAVSLRIFTPRNAEKREEEQVFGGTLFCAPYWNQTLNLRFLSSYLLCFFAFFVLLFLLCALQGVLVLKL